MSMLSCSRFQIKPLDENICQWLNGFLKIHVQNYQNNFNLNRFLIFIKITAHIPKKIKIKMQLYLMHIN